MKQIFFFVISAFFLTNCSHLGMESEPTNVKVTKTSSLEWTALNPKRGQNSPMASNLWGDRNKNAATGFLVKFKDGFSSPPHVHNVSYRGLVISGEIHNDDPTAQRMWMPTASYWTQPKGELHITSARGQNNLAYIEIESGPYKVAKKSFKSNEFPINIHTQNLVWQNQITELWKKENGLRGSLIKIPEETKFFITGNKSPADIVIIQGSPLFGKEPLTPGSHISTNEFKTFNFSTAKNGETILYLRTRGSVTTELYPLSSEPKEKVEKNVRCQGWNFTKGCKKKK